MNKLYLCGMTSAGNEKNLRDMIEPILEYFDGLVWTFHNPIEIFAGNLGYELDFGYEYLQKNKKEGKIVTANWCQRHGYSMTHYLWQGSMKEGDFFVQLDSSERLSPKFCAELRDLCKDMEEKNIGMIANKGKGLIFRYNELLEFRGSPHWAVINVLGSVAQVELEDDEFWNVRDENRDKFHFVIHYLKYYLYPAGSNHCLLGLEKNGDPVKLFPPREEKRLRFRKYLDKYEIKQEPQAIIDHFLEQKEKPLEELIQFINSEKILNDVWRYYVLKDENFKDDHNFEDMVKIE
jgi:hypothetical protein